MKINISRSFKISSRSICSDWGALKHHLLSPADQHWREKAKGHPHFVHTRLVVCDVPEKPGDRSLYKHLLHVSVTKQQVGISSYLYQGYTKFSRTNSNTCRNEANESVNSAHHINIPVLKMIRTEIRDKQWKAEDVLPHLFCHHWRYLCYGSIHLWMNLQVQPWLVVLKEQRRPGNS